MTEPLAMRLSTTSILNVKLGTRALIAARMPTPSRLRVFVSIMPLLSFRAFTLSDFNILVDSVERWYTHPGHAIPILVDDQLRPVVLLHLAYNTMVNEVLAGEDKLTFSLPSPLPVNFLVGSLLDLAGKIYRVMIINEHEDNSGLRKVEVEAWARWYDLAKMPELPARRWTNSTLVPIVLWFLDEESGWRIGNVVVSARRDFVWTGGVDRLSALRAIERVFNAEIIWDTMRRTVSFVQAGGVDAGVFFLRGKNLRKAEIEISMTDLVHRLYPYGRQGTSITPVNAGVPYLEVPSSYSPPPSAILAASELSDPQQLKEHAQAIFDVINKPQVNYSCAIVDLSTLAGYEEEKIALGDIVTVFDELANINIKTRVVRIRYNVEEPWNSDIELASLRREMSDTLKGIHSAVTEDVLRDDPGKLITNARIADYTLAITDGEGVIITMDSDKTTLLRVPNHKEIPVPIGAKIYVQRLGNGMVAIYPESGVVLQAADEGRSLRVKYSAAWLLRRFADTWTLVGDLNPVAFVGTRSTTPSRLLSVVEAVEKALPRLFAWGNNSRGRLGDGTTEERHIPTLIGEDTWVVLSAGRDHSSGINIDKKLFAWGDNRNGQLGDGTIIEKHTPTLISSDIWLIVELGNRFSLGIKADHSLWAWGRNLNGQLGDGTTTQRLSPVQIGTDLWSSVSAGWDHSLGIRSDGRLFAWGENWDGQLGDGTTTQRLVPTLIGTDTWIAVSAGNGFSLGIRSDGRLFAWGVNWSGQLGDGTTIEKVVPTLIGADLWRRISAGGEHSLAIRIDRRLFAWGANWSSQLGDGTTIDRDVPILIGEEEWTIIGAGEEFSLGIRSDGRLFAWGANWHGQLGDGTTTDRDVPTAVAGHNWELISGGSSHALGVGEPSLVIRMRSVSRFRGSLFSSLQAWGNNWGGVLGDGTTQTTRLLPVPIGNPLWKSISTTAHTLGISSDGRLYAWGYNSTSQLGDGTVADKILPVQIGHGTWSSVSAGGRHSLGIRSDGRLYAWGYNGMGQLGDGTFEGKSVPTLIGDHTWLMIAAGSFHSLGIRSDGRLFAWGDNWFGQLGDGTRINRNVPTQIGASTWNFIACGTDFSLGIQSDGRLFTWGPNWDGQLGDGTTIVSYIPTLIGVDTWIAVAGGFSHSLGIRSDGRLFAWGNNWHGQLGDGTAITRRLTPVPIGTDLWSAISAGSQHSFGIRNDRKLFAWGINDDGQLGDGTRISRRAPVQVDERDWKTIIGGGNHSFGILWT